MTNLLLITSDFPYGNGEPFIETEIKYASHYFSKIYIISLSRNNNLTRKLPANVKAFKIGRYYHLVACFSYTIWKFLGKEARCEYRDIKCLRHKPTIRVMIKSWFVNWMIEKRLSIAVRKLRLDLGNTIGYSYWMSEAAYYLAKHQQIKYRFSRAHGFEVRDCENYIPFRAYTDANLDEIVFISQYTMDEYNKILSPLSSGKGRTKQTVYRLGVERYDTHIKIVETSGTLHLLSCSTIYYLKRIDLIVKALSLVSENTKIKWVHIGWGKMANEIIALCDNLLSKKHNIEYIFLGAMSNQKVIDYYMNNKVDLFINVSDNEGIPVSVMEAMSFGVPCIGRAVGGMSEIIQDGVSGYLLGQETNPLEIAGVIERYINNEPFRVKSENVISFYKKNFSAEINYNNFFSHITNESHTV